MIYLECNSDKALIETLGVVKKEVYHAGGKGNVCNRLKNSKNSKGMIDEDPLSSQPGYINNLKILFHENEVKLLYDEKNQNYLIVLCPRLEEWILNTAKESGINVRDYSLPEGVEEFHKTINLKLDKFIDLIKDIKEKSKRLKSLQKFILTTKN